MTLHEEMTQLARDARQASRTLARLDGDARNRVLRAMADAIEAGSAAIQQANALDLALGTQSGLNAAMMDRLRLDDRRIRSMASGMRDVAALPDPVGRTIDERVRPNGLKLRKVAVPFGVVVIIYESRPNVTADAASLCFKTGNATILRGGREAMHSNQAIRRLMVEAGARVLPSFPPHAIQVVPTADRAAIPALLSLTQYVDLCMPRGGEGLIRAVTECSKVPVIKHYKGVCHVFVDRDADLDMAAAIVLNAKCQRPAVCNAMETLLVDRPIAREFLARMGREFGVRGVELRADDAAQAILGTEAAIACTELRVLPATDADYATEYNDLVLNVRIVDGCSEAMEHIAQFGSQHSDAIVTGSEPTAQRFLAEVDSAAVYWNASTRFTDGGEFGMGAEIGISTDKVGARGPMGLEELCTIKWLGIGQGQVRG